MDLEWFELPAGALPSRLDTAQADFTMPDQVNYNSGVHYAYSDMDLLEVDETMYMSGLDQDLSLFEDPQLWRDIEDSLALASPVLPYLSSGDDTSPVSESTTSPVSCSESDATGHVYACHSEGCSKTFRKESQLKQHQRVHKKDIFCTICRREKKPERKFAQVRDLERHLQARHKDVAARANVRSEERECPFSGCGHRGRRDNVSRHYESKHGRKLRWKRGVPFIVG